MACANSFPVGAARQNGFGAALLDWSRPPQATPIEEAIFRQLAPGTNPSIPTFCQRPYRPANSNRNAKSAVLQATSKNAAGLVQGHERQGLRGAAAAARRQ